MKIVYIDDSQISLAKFIQELRKINKDIEVECFTFPDAALVHCQNNFVDLAFIDINMPGQNGIEFSQHLANLKIPFVFVTAHNTYGAQAFTAGAIHYILKPVRQIDIELALTRYHLYQKFVATELESDMIKTPGILHDSQSRIYLKNHHSTHVLSINEIMYFKGAGSYTKINTIDARNYTASKSLKNYAILLEHNPDFIRIHRSSLVNRRFIKSIAQYKRRLSVILTDGTSLPMASKLKTKIQQLL